MGEADWATSKKDIAMTLNDIIRQTVEPTYRTPVEVYDILLDTTAAYGNPPYDERR